MSTTDLALIAGDTSALERAADPAEFVVLACERAKEWLKQAVEHGEIDQIVEVKSQAEAIRIYTTQKQLGKDAELAAAEIVRRAERGIGVAIRKGQEEGSIRRQGQGSTGTPPRANRERGDTQLSSPTDYLPQHELSGGGHGAGVYDVTDDVTDEQFEEAIEEAKSEKNLSRANVVRKVKESGALTKQSVELRLEQIRKLAETGHHSNGIAKKLGVTARYVRDLANQNGIPLPDAILGRTRHVDANRVLQESVTTLEGLVIGLSLIEDQMDQLDPEQVKEWAISFGASVRSLNRFRKQLEEMAL